MEDVDLKKLRDLLLAAKVLEIFAKKKIKVKKTEKDLGFLSKALKRSRRLPGAKLVRTAKPMTDYGVKAKKQLRKSTKSSFMAYKKRFVKGPQKALITKNREQAKRAYK